MVCQDCPAILHFLNLREKVLNWDIDIGSLKICFILSISSKVQTSEKIWKAIIVLYDAIYAVSRYDADKSDFVHFVNSVGWHCTILMKTARLNEDIGRAVRGVFVTADPED